MGRLCTPIGGLHGDRTPCSCCAGLSGCRLSPPVAHGLENKQCRACTSGRKLVAQDVSAHNWGRWPGRVDRSAAVPGSSIDGVGWSVGAADLQLVPSHPLLSHPDPRVRKPVVENPARRPSLPEKTGLGVGPSLLSHLIASLRTGKVLSSFEGKQLPYSGRFQLRFWGVPDARGAPAQRMAGMPAPLAGGRGGCCGPCSTQYPPFPLSMLLETRPLGCLVGQGCGSLPPQRQAGLALPVSWATVWLMLWEEGHL